MPTMEPSPESPRPANEDSKPADAAAPLPPSASTTPASASSTTAHIARFEFSDLGTKILMVEWHPGPSSVSSTSSTDTVPTAGGAHLITPPSDTAAPIKQPDADTTAGPTTSHPQSTGLEAAAWEVSWPGKSTFLPARETDHDEAGPRRRVYFLLPPEASIPTEVTITPPGRPKILVKPLPAIFPPGFDVESGTRGVLHTLWAKKRLSELEREMEAEMRANAESVGLEMAMTERQWIVENFLRLPSSVAPVPMSSRSPMPGRLGDKLKGLRLATSPADLIPSPTANTFTGTDIPSQTLSPQGGDIAVSSFTSIPRASGYSEPMSLNAAIKGEPAPVNASSRDGEDDLFALPLSPRSPDMKRGPFSALS